MPNCMDVKDDLPEPLPLRGRGNVDRKIELEKAKAINCGHCPINRGENAYGKRRPIEDRGKKLTCPRCRKGKVLAIRGDRPYRGYCSHCREYICKRGFS